MNTQNKRKIKQAIKGFIQGSTIESREDPNEETISAMRELESGGGECFNNLDELWESLER